MAVNTRKVQDRRSLRFQNLDEVRKDLDAIEQAAASGCLMTLGNWTPGQVLTHLAAFISFAYDGYPSQLKPPGFIRFIMKFRRDRYIHKGLPAGVNIPGIKGGTVGMEDVPIGEGLRRFRSALKRLEKTPPKIDNPLFGPMTHEEWMQLHMRHAELHLGFLKPG